MRLRGLDLNQVEGSLFANSDDTTDTAGQTLSKLAAVTHCVAASCF